MLLCHVLSAYLFLLQTLSLVNAAAFFLADCVVHVALLISQYGCGQFISVVLRYLANLFVATSAYVAFFGQQNAVRFAFDATVRLVTVAMATSTSLAINGCCEKFVCALSACCALTRSLSFNEVCRSK
jgi:hypothetical protein